MLKGRGWGRNIEVFLNRRDEETRCGGDKERMLFNGKRMQNSSKGSGARWPSCQQSAAKGAGRLHEAGVPDCKTSITCQAWHLPRCMCTTQAYGDSDKKKKKVRPLERWVARIGIQGRLAVSLSLRVTQGSLRLFLTRTFRKGSCSTIFASLGQF